MGTPAFALPGLSALLAAPEFEIVAVFTQTDKPVGRKQRISPSPVKEWALNNKLTIFQPTKIKTEAENIKHLQPDLIVVIAYGKIIPPEILAIPRYGCINVHASLLPKYRGAACLNAPIINGDIEGGLTIMKMDVGLDTGPILRQAIIKLEEQETLISWHDKLAQASAELLVPTLQAWIKSQITPLAQDDSRASYVKMLTKEDGAIQWSEPAEKIERLIRGLNPWPGTFSRINGQIIKISAVDHNILPENKHKIGEIFLHQGQLAVQCGQNSLLILKLQLEGKRSLPAEEFLRGNKELVGKIIK